MLNFFNLFSIKRTISAFFSFSPRKDAKNPRRKRWLSAGIVAQEDLDTLVGQHGRELFERGFTFNGYDDSDGLVFFFDDVMYEYAVTFEEAIDNDEGAGAVYADGKVWSARSAGGEPIPAGTRVRVRSIEGVKLIVSAAAAPERGQEG